MILNAKDGEGKIRRNERLEATIYILGRVNDKVWGCVGLVFVGGLWPDAYRELARVLYKKCSFPSKDPLIAEIDGTLLKIPSYVAAPAIMLKRTTCR